MVNMAHNEASLMKLNKEDLVMIILNYRGKFNNVLDDLKKDISDLKSDLSGLKSDFSKLEADIQVTTNEILRFLKDLWQWKGATLAISILGGIQVSCKLC